MAEGVLGEIAAAKRDELARRFDGIWLDSLRSKAEPTDRSLTDVFGPQPPSRVAAQRAWIAG